MPGLSLVTEAAQERAAALSAAGSGPRIRTVIAAVARESGIPVEHILSSRRTAPVALARQMAMHLAVEICGHGTVVIGRVFQRDASTVRWAHTAIRERCATDPALAGRIAALRAHLTTPGEQA